MCTAITYKTECHYFGRNLDLEYSFDESVTIVPRNYTFQFRRAETMPTHYAMIGMAYVVDEYPLFYDATNEKGLSMAGLSFYDKIWYEAKKYDPEAEWFDVQPDGGREVMVDHVSPFEFIPWVLGQCANLTEVHKLLEHMRLVPIDYSDKLKLTPLHWIIADKEQAITVELIRGEMIVYKNPVGVLANNPTFDYHMTNLSNYMNLTPYDPDNSFADNIELQDYSCGMGSLGLPGDWSSTSRFVRATYVKHNSKCGDSESESVNQFFHILDSVAMPRGCVRLVDEVGSATGRIPGQEAKLENTVYSSCCNVDKGIYYCKSYDNTLVKGYDMHREHLEGDRIIAYPLEKCGELIICN